MLDATETKLTRVGTLTIDTDTACIYVDGFSAKDGSCRDVAALACAWGIGMLQAELLTILQSPEGGRSAIGSPQPLDIAKLRYEIHELRELVDGMTELLDGIANALNGPAAQQDGPRWRDLPGRVAQLVSALDQLKEAR